MCVVEHKIYCQYFSTGLGKIQKILKSCECCVSEFTKWLNTNHMYTKNVIFTVRILVSQGNNQYMNSTETQIFKLFKSLFTILWQLRFLYYLSHKKIPGNSFRSLCRKLQLYEELLSVKYMQTLWQLCLLF